MRKTFAFGGVVVWFISMLALVSLLGCGKQSYQLGEVDGVVLINGTPASDIFVQFIPDAPGEDSPPTSNARTDENGHFILNLIEPGGSMLPGAAIGTHRVVLRDLKAAEAPAANRPRIRLPVQFTMPSSTPLTQEVNEGKQSIEIRVPPR